MATRKQACNDMTETANDAEDRRVRRTRAALRRSLIGLLRTKPLSAITTSELCRAADINRNTFYAHYKSPVDVFEAIEDEYFQVMSESMGAIGKKPLYEETRALLIATKENAELTLVLAQGREYSGNMSRGLWNLSRELWFAEWKRNGVDVSDDAKERTFAFTASGYTAVLLSWVRSGMREDIETVAHAMADMATAAIRAGLTD